MKKRKLLFVMEQLGIGGAEKSLITLLSCLDYHKYEVDLFLFRKEGEFLKFVPKEVYILPESEEYKTLHVSPVKSIYQFIKKRKYKLVCVNLAYLIKLVFSRFFLHKEYIGWDKLEKFLPIQKKRYDVAIGYMEKKSIYFVVDKVNAVKKIGYIHTDYQKIEHDKTVDNLYFNNLDYIVTVSKHCREVLIGNFMQHTEKVKVIENIVAPEVIRKMATEEIEDVLFDATYNNLVTVARLVEAKGIDIALHICHKLVENNIKVRWYIIGEGHQRKELENAIKTEGLESSFILLGERSNPYKYMKMADIYVQPSRYEGYGITVAEAKVLYKPIVTSNIPEFQEQLKHMKTGFLCNDFENMLDTISSLVKDENKKNAVVFNLQQGTNMNYKLLLDDFYKLIGDN